MPSCSCQNKIGVIEERLLFLEGLLVKGNLCLDGDLIISGKIIGPRGQQPIIGPPTAPGDNACNFSAKYTGSKSPSDLLTCLSQVIISEGGTFEQTSTGGTFTLPANIIGGNPQVSGSLNISGNLITGSVVGTTQPLTASQCHALQAGLATLIKFVCP